MLHITSFLCKTSTIHIANNCVTGLHADFQQLLQVLKAWMGDTCRYFTASGASASGRIFQVSYLSYNEIQVIMH